MESYKDSFAYIQDNLTEWLKKDRADVVVVSGERINVSELAQLKAELSGNSVIAVAADNKYALSWFAGAHYFDGQAALAYTADTLIATAREAGFDEADIHMYYPYPDLRLPLALYSDDYLPKQGELTNNYRNFNTDRLYIFDEAAKWDEIIADGKFTDFANSFLMVLECGNNACMENDNATKSADKKRLPVFVKYSNDRAEQYRICTKIYDENGRRRVVKSPLTDASAKHIAELAVNREKLVSRYAGFEKEHGVKILVNECIQNKDGAEFEYLEQEPLESRLVTMASKKRGDEIKKIVKTFANMVRYNADAGVWDIDLIFKNIFVNKPGDEWTIIDYEWTWDVNGTDTKEIADYIIQRAVYYLIADNPQAGFEELDLYGVTGTKKPELAHRCYEIDNESEREFQKQVRGNHLTLSEIYERTHGRIYDVGQLVENDRNEEYRNSISVEDAAFTDNHAGESHELTIDIKGRTQVTIQPAHCCCFVYLRGTSVKCRLQTNGIRITKRLYAFTNTEPQMTFKLPQNPGDTLNVDLFVSGQGVKDSPVFEAVVKALSWKRFTV